MVKRTFQVVSQSLQNVITWLSAFGVMLRSAGLQSWRVPHRIIQGIFGRI